MKKLILTLAIVAGVYGLSNAQKDNKLIVNVSNIKSNKGDISVAVSDSEKAFLGKPMVSKTQKAKQGELVFEFEVPNGAYTVRVMHDENKSGDLDKNFLGIPLEPYGISMEGKSKYGPPTYEDAVFSITNKNVKLTIQVD